MLLGKLKKIGPGAMVAAAFIGPGTVTTATMAGASYGYTLLWAVLFSTMATLLLQEMSARLGVIGGMGVGQAIRSKFGKSIWFYLISILIISAILIGNAAYEAGNISGAALGFSTYFIEEGSYNYWPLILGMIAFVLLFSASYRLIEKALILLVGILGIVFIASACLIGPDYRLVLTGLFVPSLPKGALILVVGLIGTTVVPYNLFLHASVAKSKWNDTEGLSLARTDTYFSVFFGGLITMCILITSAAAFNGQSIAIDKASDLALSLQSVLGDFSIVFISLGFLAAGLSSSITAPLAAAYAVTELLGRHQKMGSWGFRGIWLFVLITGIVTSSIGLKPTSIILFSQFANGLVLPIIAIFLLWVMNDQKILKYHINNRWNNLLGILVIIVTIILGIKSILSATHFF